MSTVIRSESGKTLTLEQGMLFDMPNEEIVVEVEPIQAKQAAPHYQEAFLIQQLRHRIDQLEDELTKERAARRKAWERAEDAIEAEHFLRRFAQYVSQYQKEEA